MSDGSVAGPASAMSGSSAGFERLDTLVRVTTVQSWVYLALLFAVGVAAAGFAVFYKVPTKVTGEGILLTEKDTISLARAQATGRLVSLRVKLGQFVKADAAVGEISQDDLKDSIREEELRLKDLEAEDTALSLFDAHEKTTHEARDGPREAGHEHGPAKLNRQAADRPAAGRRGGPAASQEHHERPGSARLVGEVL